MSLTVTRWSLVVVVVLLSLASSALVVRAGCPEDCVCDADVQGRKRVSCSRGGIYGSLPMLDGAGRMDADTKVFVVTAPRDNPNELTIGRTFMKYQHLEEVHITDSFIPAIGEKTFWGLTQLRLLNLTRNNITSVVEDNFKGLNNLERLHLDQNNIMAMPSAAFRFVESLRNLTMARNRLDKLVPLMFMGVPRLEHLDLSWNPIQEIDSENFKEIPHLRRLYLSHCQLTICEAKILRLLPNLEVLDLSYNHLQFVSPEDFKPLPRLKALYLAGNNLTTILENTFFGHNLTVLTLSRNQIRNLLQESFNNLSVRALDLGWNRLKFHDPEILRPVAEGVIKLDISGNQITESVLSELIDRFPNLKDLSITGLNLVDLNPHQLEFPKTLKKLNASHNQLQKFSSLLLDPLTHLEVLDLSFNKFHGLDKPLIEHLDDMPVLRSLHLNGNPWACDRCYIPALRAWLNNSKHFEHACYNLHRVSCLKCASPYNLSGRAIQFVDEEELQECAVGDIPALSMAGTVSHLGIIVVVVVIVLLLVSITLVLVLYYRRGADYYTGEEREDGIYENPGIEEENGDLLEHSIGSTKKPQIATIENMDEFKDDVKFTHSGSIVC